MSLLNGSAMASAELAQARRISERAMMEREQYVRLTALLAKAVTGKTAVGMIDGNVCFKKSAFDAVPEAYTVSLRGAKLKDPNATDPDAKEEEYVVVVVSDAKPRPTLVVARPTA